jgi:exodeoxyribonuclease V beta subunit
MKSLRGGYRAPIDTGADLTEEPEGAEAPAFARDALPGGAAAGVFLHEVLEAIDFGTLNQSEDFETWAANEDVRRLFRKLLRRNAFPDRYLAHSQKLVHTALTTAVPLNAGQSIRFHQVAREIREVEFVYPYPEAHHPGIAEGIEQPFRIERGYVKGFVDFVFEHRGLTYFADWKSDSLPTWDTDTLTDHVQLNYKLQAQLYSLALIKMLGIRTERYFKARFGGLLYIFLRGLHADGDSSSGVYFEEPTWEQILDWEKELIGKTRL